MKIIISLALALSLTACASISTKQRISTTHQAAHQALVAVDDAERALCQPRPTATNECASPTAATLGLTDARHQAFSRALAKAYDSDAKAGVAILAWRAGDPVPADLTTLLQDAADILATARSITDQPLLDRAMTLLARVQAVVGAFSQ